MVQAPISVIATDPNVQTPLGGKRANSEPITFVALPVAFEYTDAAFVGHFLPWVRRACLWLQRDHIGVEALVRDMVRHGGEFRLDEADQAWASCAEIFGAINEFVEAAKVRLSIARAQLRDKSAERALQMRANERRLQRPMGRRPVQGGRKKKVPCRDRLL
jgi:hypothetical protein